MARGRPKGFRNYSIAEQIHLCKVAKKILPTGANMWQQAATLYNAKRKTSWKARDYESLRRKFRSLYSRAKPTGINGAIPRKLRPVLKAQEIQQAIEKKGGVTTSHDGPDGGQDDVRLLAEVTLTAGNPSMDSPLSSWSSDDNDNDGENASSSDGEAEDSDDFRSERLDDISQYGQVAPSYYSQDTPNRFGRTEISHGPLDASLDSFLGALSDGDGENRENERPTNSQKTAPTTATTPISPTPPTAKPSTPPSQALTNEESAETQATPVPAPLPHTSASEVSSADMAARTSSRPRGSRQEPRPTFASPEGRPLNRDAAKAAEDNREATRHKKKTTTSNRLGGGDLRVVRDNIDMLSGRQTETPGAKRAQSENASAKTSYTTNKRVRARQRLERMEKALTDAEEKHATAGSEMMQMLVMLREESDRRAEVEDRRRREDREDRLAAERQERDERERIMQRLPRRGDYNKWKAQGNS